MKKHMLVVLVVALSIVATQPAAATAADFEEMTTVRSGTFTGARIRILLGGPQHEQTIRASLTIAPTWRSQTIMGETRTRFGEGLELGFGGKHPLAVSLGGRKTEDDKRLGTSTGGKVAIGLGVVALVAGAVVLGVVISQSDDAPDES